MNNVLHRQLKIKEILISNVADGKAQLHDDFPAELRKAPLLPVILTNPAIINGLHFEHLWFVNNQNFLYQSHVISVKCSKRSNVPKVTSTYWKHDYDRLWVFSRLFYWCPVHTLILIFNIWIYICTLHVVKFWRDNIERYNICSKENINRHNFFYDRAYLTVHSKCSVVSNAVTFDTLTQMSCISYHYAAFFFCSCRW